MQEDEPWDEIENHPDINRAMGQGMRGIPQINDHDANDMAQDSLIPRKHKKTKQLAGMVLNDASQKSKTTNMTEILSQVNKKSKSTKNQRAQGIQYAFAPPAGDANLAAGSQAINIVQQCAKQKAQRGIPQEHQNDNPNKIKRNSFFQQVYPDIPKQDANQRHLSRKMDIDETANAMSINQQMVDMDTEFDEIMDIDQKG